MMPYDAYRLYKLERANTPAEARRADEQAGRLAAAVARLVRDITRPVRSTRPAPRAHSRTAQTAESLPGH